MIEVRATKSTADSTDPADRFVLKAQDNKGRGPLRIGILLSAIALYLKSALPSAAESQLADEDTGRALRATDGAGAPAADELRMAGEAARAPQRDGPAAEVPSNVVQLFASRMSGPQNLWGDAGGPGGARAFISAAADRPFAAADFLRFASGAETAVGNGAVALAVGSGTQIAASDQPSRPPARNQAPAVSQPVYRADVVSGMAAMIALSDLLANATDAEGSALSVRNLTVSSGTIAPAEGGFLYTADPGVIGEVQLRYQISDGTESASQTMNFSVVPNPILGTATADDLDGTSAIDQISGDAGDDRMQGGAGNDIIAGDDGNDQITGGDGNDVIFGGAGHDMIDGGAGDDIVWGGEGRDSISGANGNDILFGGAGDDMVSDGTGNDVVDAGTGNDTIIATRDTQNDVLDGGEGNDTLDYSNLRSAVTVDFAAGTATGAEIGVDTIIAIEAVISGAGNDRFIVDATATSMNGGGGRDTLDYSSADETVTIDLVVGTASGVEIGTDLVFSFEAVIGGEGDDHFLIGATATVMSGGSGDNTFEFQEIATLVSEGLTRHQILDFGVGDIIRTDLYDIFNEATDAMQDMFQAVYGDEGWSNGSGKIRYRYEGLDEDEMTILEVLGDEMTGSTVISMNGHQILIAIEHT